MSEVERFLKIEEDGLAATKYVSVHLDGWVVVTNEPHSTMQFSPKQLEELTKDHLDVLEQVEKERRKLEEFNEFEAEISSEQVKKIEKSLKEVTPLSKNKIKGYSKKELNELGEYLFSLVKVDHILALAKMRMELQQVVKNKPKK